VLSTVADLLFISVLANRGIAMAPLSLAVLATILGAAVVFWIFLSIAKIPVFAKLRLS
jgi:H+-transporting ATPase